jgi:hypothetical protein
MPWTVGKFIELLKRHGTLGPYVNADNSGHACIDGWVDLAALVAELNQEYLNECSAQAVRSVKHALAKGKA